MSTPALPQPSFHSDEPVLLALGDPHGFWRRAAAILRAWHDVHGRWPDGILCVGDNGYFPDSTRLDKATRKHAAAEPEQLAGFLRLLAPGGDPVVEALLDGAPTIHTVAGNHEAHADLLRLCAATPPAQQVIPLDAMGRLSIVRDGAVIEVGPWRVAGLWGITPGANRKKPRIPGKHLDPAVLTRIARERFDILLSHDAPLTDQLPVRWAAGDGPGGTGVQDAPGDVAGRCGSVDIRALLERRPGALSLFGHYHFRQGHRFPVGSATAAQLGILRADVPSAAAAIRGGPGAWEVTWMGEDPAWWTAHYERLAELPPLLRPDLSG
jgi:hypothetical protein